MSPFTQVEHSGAQADEASIEELVDDPDLEDDVQQVGHFHGHQPH